VTARVEAYFAQTGKTPQYVPGMRLKTVMVFVWLIGSYLVGLLACRVWWQVALASISVGLAMASIGFNVQHDGSHRGYSPRARTNTLAAAALDFIGASSYVWAWKHNILHHSNPNWVGLDADIDIQPLCRLSPAQARRPWQRLQHLYIWFLYSLLAFKWLFDDFRDVANGAVGGQRFPRPRGWKLVQFLSGKAIFVGWSFVLPCALHPVANAAAAWLLGSVAISLAMALTFQMAHVVEGVSFPPRASDGTRRWAEHQVEATADFAQQSRFWTWIMGGLNFQIEHHLFPRLCHMHLPAIAPIVKATCEEFGIRYHVFPTAGRALASHARWLRWLGQPASEALVEADGAAQV
jgi:linoleoyl-CoA desaturase